MSELLGALKIFLFPTEGAFSYMGYAGLSPIIVRLVC